MRLLGRALARCKSLYSLLIGWMVSLFAEDFPVLATEESHFGRLINRFSQHVPTAHILFGSSSSPLSLQMPLGRAAP